MSRPELVLIAAMDRNRVIGKNQTLPWRLSADLKRFKSLTTGHPILMGRKTWESIGRPLPGRRNLVLTRQHAYTAEGAEVVHSTAEALALCADAERLFVIGGEAVYAECLPLADRVYVTFVETEVEEGDAWFPEWDSSQFRVENEIRLPADEKNQFPFRFVDYVKKT
ncbi:MAG: dihydrofolate reductase [Kiritimatiellia bacterium]